MASSEEDTSSIQTVIQRDPCVRVSVAWRESSGLLCSGCYYWESICFSDDPRLEWFQGGTAFGRLKAQRIHDNIARCVRKYLRENGGINGE